MTELGLADEDETPLVAEIRRQHRASLDRRRPRVRVQRADGRGVWPQAEGTAQRSAAGGWAQPLTTLS